ncbi:MAG: flagellar biosynthesis protein FlhB [Proteobacteria bacterium]|nr:flagellar biosynthesis protein FlhB [Pseudomonadota bacterium]MBI3496796.1 flagellar biosynthesis protein FlhB [Pseudomonadota bacterium]
MSEDDSGKTEEPSGKKLGEARSRGQTWASREVGSWAMLSVLLAMVYFLLPRMVRDVGSVALPFIEKPDQISLDQGNLGNVLTETMLALVPPLTIPLILVLIASIAPSIAQSGFIFTTHNLKPSFSKLSLAGGLQRLVSVQAMLDMAKNIGKMLIVGSVAGFIAFPELSHIESLVTAEIVDAAQEMQSIVVDILGGTLVVLAIMAVGDVFYQRHKFYKQLRMTKQEVKDEFKQAEGDPTVKGRLRQIRFDRARARMMQAVPKADVVITNPTHYAVALEYKPDKMDAPKLTAKGADLIAKRIREVAEENGVPVVENPPIARALYASVEIDQEIPPEHYKAVAEIISYVYKLKRKTVPA